MSKRDAQAAEAAAAQAELRAMIAEQDARHAEIEAADRIARERMLAEFKREWQADRREFMASTAEEHETPAVTPPRDEHTGRWLPAAPPEPEPQADLRNLSLAEYAKLRGELGIDKAGVEHVGRAPGHERSEFLGHSLADGSGFPSWNDHGNANTMVFRSQLTDNRRQAPIGYQRQAGEQDEWR